MRTYFPILGFVVLLYTTLPGPAYAQTNPKKHHNSADSRTSSDKTLLSRLYGTMSLKRIKRSFNTYSCKAVQSMELGGTPPVITVNGSMKSMTAILVGYGGKEVSGLFRTNKGYVYGIGNIRGTRTKSTHSVGFSIDYAPPEKPLWQVEEFCMLVFTPALTPGPSLRSLVGKRHNHPNRYLGSTENIVDTLIRESAGTNSKFVTQCCFLMYQ
ncbi:hypothetical protein protein, putative [Babesia ovis]|uniref:Uncharacterized protein n=1 Tax=Babesia ovis TaxID=5869 RepID=A0A9W5TDZ8_BABOV|nr:hypothetical protein protein, putative [Babesia ovis]